MTCSLGGPESRSNSSVIEGRVDRGYVLKILSLTDREGGKRFDWEVKS